MSARSPRVGLFLRGGSYAYQDEIIAGACITHEGEIRNERAAKE